MWKTIDLFMLLVLLCSACSDRKTLSYPGDGGSGGGGDTPGPRQVSIAYLKSLYAGYPYRIAEDMVLEGRVIANDANGNYYHTIVVSDETGGIEVKIEYDRLFEIYRLGYPVRIGCNGLTLGAYGGLIQLGYPSSGAYETGYIPEEEFPGYVLVSGEAVPIVPDTMTVSSLGPSDVSTYVAFAGVQFIDEELGLRWSESDADTDRHLVDRFGDTLRVRTNHRASFAERKLPVGSGYIEGILSWFNGRYQLRVTDVRNVIMEEARFEPVRHP